MKALKMLPEKYYLDHFNEFLAYIEGPCAHLLAAPERAFVDDFRALNEAAQCLLVRLYNRKSDWVARDALVYAEINDIPAQLAVLAQCHWLQPFASEDIQLWLADITKQQLQQLYQHYQRVAADGVDTRHGDSSTLAKPPTKSAAKAGWLSYLQTLTAADSEPALAWANQHFVRQGRSQVLRYLLFLYFGRTQGRLNQLSMRDLGIMRTRRLAHEAQARFASADEAFSAFEWKHQSDALKQTMDAGLLAFAQQLPTTSVGVAAQATASRLYARLGKRMLDSELSVHPQALALSFLARSNEPEAVEKSIRVRYAAGEHEAVREQLEDIIDNPDSETLWVFASDFYARKFGRKRTSVLTDMLRDSAPAITLDEAFLGNVETGVKQYYQSQGIEAFKTENRIWRALFGLVFWHELFVNPKAGLATEFDRLPAVLKSNQFFFHMQAEIEARLQQFDSSHTLRVWLLKVSSQYYGQGNGVFRWHPKMLEILDILLTHVSVSQLQQILLAMAKDYHALSDGYPDLMVLESGQLRFEEIKAPGDSLRRNQLISLQMLNRAGLNVAVRRVEWAFNPEQAYVVVDVETTGGNSAGNRMTEIGMVKVVNAKVVASWQSLINPQRAIPRHITQLTGISQAMVADAPIFSEVVDEISDFLKGAVFVAHNVNFDYGFFKREYELCGRYIRLPKLCTVKLARQHFTGLASYSLGRLCADLDIQLARHHRALDDARAAAEILIRIQRQGLRQGS